MTAAKKKKKKKGHPAAPAPPPRNREHGESFNRSGGKGRADSVLGLIVWLLFELVLVATVLAQTLAAIDDRDAAADFRSAPLCLSQPAPAVQDCRSWQDVMVTATSAVTSRGSTTYTITAGSYVVTYFDSAPAWIKHVAKGQQVEMLVWEGNPEALRSPSGDVEYTEDAAPSRHSLHIAGAALTASGMFFSMLFGLFLFGRPARRGRRRLATYTGLASAGVAAITFGAAISSVNGVQGLLIALVVGACFAGLALLVTFGLHRRRRHRKGRPAPEPADALHEA